MSPLAVEKDKAGEPAKARDISPLREEIQVHV